MTVLGPDMQEAVRAVEQEIPQPGGPQWATPNDAATAYVAAALPYIYAALAREAPVVVWRCPECRLLSSDGGTVPHRDDCSLRLVRLELEPAFRGFRADPDGED